MGGATRLDLRLCKIEGRVDLVEQRLSFMLAKLDGVEDPETVIGDVACQSFSLQDAPACHSDVILWSGNGPSDPLPSTEDDFEVISDGESVSQCSIHEFERVVESPVAKQEMFTPPTGSTHAPVTPSLGWSPSGAGDGVHVETEPIARELSFSQADPPGAPSSSLASTTTTTCASWSCTGDATLPHGADVAPAPSEVPEPGLALTPVALPGLVAPAVGEIPSMDALQGLIATATLESVPEGAVADTAWQHSQHEVTVREMAMLRQMATAKLLEVEPGTSPELLRYLEQLDYSAFSTVLCAMDLGLTFQKDFRLLGSASPW